MPPPPPLLHLTGEFRNRFRPSVCTTIFKRIAGLRFYPKYLMLYINGFVSTSSTNLWKAFFNFRIFGRKPKIFQMISKAFKSFPWTSFLSQIFDVIHPFIRLNELYNLNSPLHATSRAEVRVSLARLCSLPLHTLHEPSFSFNHIIAL